MRNLATILPLQSKLSGKFQYFNAIDRSIKMLFEFSNISIKMNDFKTFYETQTASHFQEIIQPSPNPPLLDKMLLHLWNKTFLTEIYRNIQTFGFQSTSKMQFLGVKKYCSANVFPDTKQKHVGWKVFKVRKIFGCIAGAYYLQC